MINLRYHIVSITAVFLALGIGLAFGAAFIDRATVDQLERNLRDIERQNDQLELRNEELTGEVEDDDRIQDALLEEGLGELVAGRLTGVPVLVIAAGGVDGDLVAAAEAAVIGAGADVPGVLRVTDRFALDDESELEDLRTVLNLPDAGEDQLRVAVTRRVRTILAVAAGTELPVPGDDEPGAGSATSVPPLLDALLADGFLEFDAADDPPAEFALLPESGLRILAISGAGATVADGDFLTPVVSRLVGPDPIQPSGPAPIVVAGEATPPPEPPETEGEPPPSFVAPLRADEAGGSRLSTIDHLDSFAGLVAAVLALDHAADGQFGHYGTDDGSQSLLPAPVTDRRAGDGPLTTIARAVAGMGAVTAVSRAVGFVRVLVIAAVLGTTYLGNAFQAANSLSNVLFELLAAGALSAVLVPTFVGLLDAGDRQGAEEVAGGVLWAALAGLGAVTVAGVAAAPLLARLLTIGVPGDIGADQRQLVTHLLRFFLPQVLLYAAGTIATAVLHARRSFAVTAAAPIGNTVVMVAALLAFRAAAGDDPGLDLDGTERMLLVIAGTGGVLAFVGILLAACRASGFRLRPRRPRGDTRVTDALRHSAWGAVLHTGAGILLGTAIVVGSGDEGAVVAYQVGWVFFLAPYGILAQPIHTAILPELVAEAHDPDRFAASVRWALERIALLVLPVSAGMVALAGPGMRVLSFGETGPQGARLLGAAVGALAVGLLPYSAFLLLSRASYAVGDSRTPGVVALATAAAGAVVMVAGFATEGAARVVVLGLGHSAAYLLGALVLASRVRHLRLGDLVPAGVGRLAALAVAGGAVAWAAQRGLPLGDGRGADLLRSVAGAAAGLVLVVGGYRLLHLEDSLSRRLPAAATPLETP